MKWIRMFSAAFALAGMVASTHAGLSVLVVARAAAVLKLSASML